MNFDVIIVGGGPAGLTSGIYAARGGKSVLLIEKSGIGGQAALANEIENYSGFSKISGFELAENIRRQAEGFGVRFIYDEVVGFDFQEEEKKVTTAYSGEYFGKNVILCMGTSPRKLGLANEERFIGLGVSYCATCDGNFFKGKRVAVVGGGDTALADSLYLKNLATEVFLIHRRDRYRGTTSLVARLAEQGIMEYKSFIVTELIGEERLTAVKLKNLLDGREEILPVDGLFVAVGSDPNTETVKDLLHLENGYIVTDEEMKTAVKGVFACGDVRKKGLRQVITACADGAIAGNAIE